jgi:glutamine cyclotransferase
VKKTSYGFIVLLFASCANTPSKTDTNNTYSMTGIPVIPYAVTGYFPHDSSLFVEGFLLHNGKLYESTGSPSGLPQYKSIIGITDLNTGKCSPKIEIDKSKYFGEGIAILNNKLYQLTYTTHVGFIYDLKTYKKIGQFAFKNRWGYALTTDGSNLIMSDGSDTLTYINPATMEPIKILKITENNFKRDSLNELEYINGYIYANIWYNNNIVKIDPVNGKVIGKIDLSALDREAKAKNPDADVLNGIAFDADKNKIYVTGKMWLNIYQIDFAH